MMLDLASLDFGKGGGLITVVAQDALTGCVLMLAHADREALELTMATGEMHYRSRTRGLWRKGETSGNVQHVLSLTADCDGDAVLARVTPSGPACHTGSQSCFDDGASPAEAFGVLEEAIHARSEADARDLPLPTPSYTRRLLADRNLRLKKIGEEATELVMALADRDGARTAEECADLVFHVLVALRDVGVSLDDVRRVLQRRAGSTDRRPPETEG
jgi:phosphoribosyl-ATP pyrophosphohydrolase/phosphoribosyl-AMP cyclohydrolase